MSTPRFGWCFVAETPCAMRARKLRFVPSQNEKFCVNQQFCKWLNRPEFRTDVVGEDRTMKTLKQIAAVLMAFGLATASWQARAEQLKIASPVRGSWEGAIPELGKQQGIFQKYGLDLEILYTQGGGETLQVVISGSVDIGLSA